MDNKHIFVATIDVGEVLPFSVSRSEDVAKDLEHQKAAREELERFVTVLKQKFGEGIWHMGMDVIDNKTYERFIFEHGGFFEVMVESPLAMNAHFVHRDRADRFCDALKNTLKEILGDSPMTDMFIQSIEVHEEDEHQMTYQKYDRMKEIRNS